jgi:hypothetical protein
LAGDFLHDVVRGGVELAHVVAVDEVDDALLACPHEQVRMGNAAQRVGEQQHAARSKIRIRLAQG